MNKIKEIKKKLVGNMRKLPKVQILSGSTDDLIKS